MLPTAIRFVLSTAAAMLFAFAVTAEPSAPGAPSAGETATTAPPVSRAVATFGSGCYWCTESDFDKVAGVLETTSGFMGGRTRNPTYDDVAEGGTGHIEVVQVTYDPAKVSYQDLVAYYWRHTDVLDDRGQFCDRGSAYRPVIFTHTDEQQRIATQSKGALDASGRFAKPVAVAIKPAMQFWPGPREHQNFHLTHAFKYKFYRLGCGRDARLKKLWGDESGT